MTSKDKMTLLGFGTVFVLAGSLLVSDEPQQWHYGSKSTAHFFHAKVLTGVWIAAAVIVLIAITRYLQGRWRVKFVREKLCIETTPKKSFYLQSLPLCTVIAVYIGAVAFEATSWDKISTGSERHFLQGNTDFSEGLAIGVTLIVLGLTLAVYAAYLFHQDSYAHKDGADNGTSEARGESHQSTPTYTSTSPDDDDYVRVDEEGEGEGEGEDKDGYPIGSNELEEDFVIVKEGGSAGCPPLSPQSLTC